MPRPRPAASHSASLASSPPAVKHPVIYRDLRDHVLPEPRYHERVAAHRSYAGIPKAQTKLTKRAAAVVHIQV